MPGRWSLLSPFSGSEKFMTTLFLNCLDHEDGGIYITNIHDVISHTICIFTSTAARTANIQLSLAFVMVHRRVRPEAVQYRVIVYTLTANMWNVSNRQFEQMVRMYVYTHCISSVLTALGLSPLGLQKLRCVLRC